MNSRDASEPAAQAGEPASPRCPVPGHEHSRVVRGGRYGKPGRQRQLYVCSMSKPGSLAPTHRFSLPLGGVSPTAVLDAGADLRAARRYQFTASEVAEALVAVSRGESYAEAGRRARESAARRWGRLAPTSVRHGSLVSDWVEVYADPILEAQEPYRDAWPGTVIVAVREFTVRGVFAFAVFAAAAFTPDGEFRVVALRVASGTGRRQWETFLRELRASRPGAPDYLVGDPGASFAGAVRRAWEGSEAPQIWLDEHDLREQARGILRRRGLDGRESDLWQRLRTATRSDADWEAFTRLADRHRLPELDAWLREAAPTVRRQLSLRDAMPHHSRTALQAALDALVARIPAARVSAFGNRARTNRLLSLMALDLSGAARVNSWTSIICDWLDQQGGQPAARQRELADRGGRNSMRRI